jgi:SAM-dependent methyltransferase
MACVDWTAVAPAWDSQRRNIETMKASLTEYQLRELGALAGARVLELGSGTGELAARLAGLAGPTGSLVASDAAEGMLALERTRLAGLPNAEVAQVDARQIPFPDESFDVVVFRMGLMLMPDPDGALQEIRRVLRPGGRLAVAVWGAPQDNPWLTALGMAAMMHGLVSGGPPVGPGGPFSLADPDDLEKRVRNAGFGQVSVVPIESTRHFAGADEHFDMVRALAPPIAAALAAAPAEKATDVRRTFDGLVAQYADADGLHLPVRALSCLARD